MCQIPGVDANVGGDAVEIPDDDQLQRGGRPGADRHRAVRGPAPNYMKYVWFDLDAGVFTRRRIRHAERHGVRPCQRGRRRGGRRGRLVPDGGVGQPAAPQCFPACLNSFSSAGGAPILFGKNGGGCRFRWSASSRASPAPDGGNTTFFFFDLELRDPGHHRAGRFPELLRHFRVGAARGGGRGVDAGSACA